MPADDFKKMYKQKLKELEKAYKSQVHFRKNYSHLKYFCLWQQKQLKDLKAHGQSKKAAVSLLGYHDNT